MRRKWLLWLTILDTQSSRFLPLLLSQTKPARGNTPFATIRLTPRGSFSFERTKRALGMGGREGVHACNRVPLLLAPLLSHLLARRACTARAWSLEDSRRNHHHTRFGCDKKKKKKWKNAPSDPLAYTACHACTRARDLRGTGEKHAHDHMSFHMSMVLRTREQCRARTLPCQPPVVAVETKTEIRASERASEREKKIERMRERREK